MKTKILALCVGVSLCGFTPSAKAVDNLIPTDLSSLLDAQVLTVIKTVAIGGDHRAYMPASPLGLAIGFDLGIDVTLIKIPQDFTDAMKAAGVSTTAPTSIPVPRINIHKGLPFGIDIGFSYFKYLSIFSVLGFDLKYAILPGGAAMPAVAARISYNKADIFFITTHVLKIDGVVSKKLGWFFDPYFGAGLQFASGDLSFSLPVAQGLSASVSGHKSFTTGHFYFGLPLKLVFFTLTSEYDYSFAGISTIGLKASLSF